MKFRKYSIEFKLKCLEIAKKYGIYKISKYIGIDKTCIKKWIINEKKFLNIKDKKNTFRLSNRTSMLLKSEGEKEIIDLILRCKEIGIPINTQLVIDELLRIDPKLQKLSKSTLKKWCYSFYKRNNFNILELRKINN